MNSSESEFAAMTVNERLFVAQLLPSWDAAIAKEDREAAADLLGKVDLADQADAIVEAALASARGGR